MQALVLAGGEGTRLRPLTLTVPKPVMPLAGRPFLSFMLDWLRGHGVDEVLLSCGFLAHAVADVLGDEFEGMRLIYVNEDSPLGTAGPMRLAEDEGLLADRLLVLNGDVLTDMDLTTQIAFHDDKGAAATLALIAVDDTASYGVVPTNEDGSVIEFLEKSPGPAPTNRINAGAYVLERSVVDLIPSGRSVSFEREVFPALVGNGLYGFHSEGYWIDIGTPERYLESTYDLLAGRVDEHAARPRRDGLARLRAGAHGGCARGAAERARAALLGGRGLDGGPLGAALARDRRLRLPDPAERAGRGRARGGRRAGRPRRDDRQRRGDSPRRDRGGGRARGPGRPAAMSDLSRDAIAAIDPQGMLGLVLEQPAQLTDALWRVDSAGIAASEAPGGLAVCGMGGSAIGADLAAAAIGRRALHPLSTLRGYELDSWIGPETAVLCASYSGNTEETLSCWEAAGAAGARRIALSTGGKLAELARAEGVPVIGVPSGFQPRAAVGYMTVCVLETAALCGAAPSLRPEVEAAARLLGELAEEWGPDAPEDSAAKSLARTLQGTTAVVYGAGATAPVARRWKAQINENAKLHAFFSELPEADHNEICAWESPGPPLSAVFLDDPAGHPRLRRRIELTARAASPGANVVERVEARGESALERVMSLVFLGDLVSVYLAALDGTDPTPIDVLDRFKASLG